MKTPLITALGLALLSTAGAHAGNELAGHEMSKAQHVGMRADASYEIGALRIEKPFSRASLPNQPVGGGFFTVTNTGTEDDRLVAAGTSADLADHMEIHEMAMEGQVMKMRALPDGLVIPAGETVELKPGGYHLMLMGLKQPLVMGESVTISLTFEKAGTIEVPLAIGAPNAKGAGHGQMTHGN
ncbi:copper chaperone PCu(A)C [Alloyangia pacifica]|uniref:Copper(I)-binding protein n=1 Tax=Alloyangia pacifica TaxID=311180 RepID=A0A1I6RIL4_9RHOB|nr:copper chaperone PCu(A)C [Alloyangia pacifica]SDG51674.1 Copper(I)-binding protein [Alloyangia pacifica]SFS64603.1 Copper(I)-binding protein [Alloyangia pacifica]